VVNVKQRGEMASKREKKEPRNNISIYLIKEEIKEFNDIFDEEYPVLFKYIENEKVAFYQVSSSKQPDWINTFFKENELPKGVVLMQASSSVVLLRRLKVDEKEGRIFAVTFGRGKTLLKEDAFEEQFGLKVVLNSINVNKIRKITKQNIGKNFKMSQEQMPKESDINEFGFDKTGDIIRSLTAKSDEEIFCKNNISGGDIFNVKVNRTIDNIDEFLLECYKKFNSTKYRENFGWLDNIKAVRDKQLIQKLNNQLVIEINERDEKIFMAVPEFIDWEEVGHIKISGNREDIFDDIYIEEFIKTFDKEKIEDFEKIKGKEIKAYSADDEEQEIFKWSADKCIFATITFEEKTYAINNGKWYLINNEFSKEINEDYNNIAISNIEMPNYEKNPETKKNDEGKYNEITAKKLNGTLLDKKLNYAYGNPIEPCDIFVSNTFIHVKISGGSADLSHLFNQASVASEALCEEKFRKKVNEKVGQNEFLPTLNNNFQRQDYTITLGIITKPKKIRKDGRPEIPFFSKVAIRYAKKTIENMSYNFNIKAITDISK
jgi:uncharacterized protein (TIGR04141 family)